MRTSKPLATISYNTPQFLDIKLKELMKIHKVEFYFYIYHMAEKDESKNHIHLWLSPNKVLDTMDLQEFFIEPDINNPTKPFKVQPFRSSVMADALLYFLHDPTYLQFKQQSREYHYTLQDIKSPDKDTIEEYYRQAWYDSDFAEWRRRRELLQVGLKYPADMILSGQIPLQQANALLALSKMTHYGLYRNGRETHSPLNEDSANECNT